MTDIDAIEALQATLARDFASAFIRIRGAHNPAPGEPCAWCRLAGEQAAEAVMTTVIRDRLAVAADCGRDVGRPRRADGGRAMSRINGRATDLAQQIMANGVAAQYRKTAAVWAFPLSEALDVDTPEGTMRADIGDYLVSDDPPTHLWPVKRAVFERTYAPGVPEALPSVEQLARALHATGLNSIGRKPGSHGKWTKQCICNLDAAAILAALRDEP